MGKGLPIKTFPHYIVHIPPLKFEQNSWEMDLSTLLGKTIGLVGKGVLGGEDAARARNSIVGLIIFEAVCRRPTTGVVSQSC